MQKRAAFLKGFMKGLSIDSNSDYGKAIKEIVACISEIADEFDDLSDRIDYLEGEMCNIHEALGLECDCGYNNECCRNIKCEKCGTENCFSGEHIENFDCNCKCQNCGGDLKIDECNCCVENCDDKD